MKNYTIRLKQLVMVTNLIYILFQGFIKAVDGG